MKKLLVGVVVGATVLATASIAMASPAQIYANMKGITVEQAQVIQGEEGIPFGRLAALEGSQEEFRQQMLEHKRVIINERVEQGRITEEQGQQLTKGLEERMANCDGSSSADIEKMRMGFNRQGGRGLKKGNGMGFGKNF